MSRSTARHKDQSEAPRELVSEAEHEKKSLLEHLLTEPSPATRQKEGPFVAECTDARHPTLVGRVHIRWSDEAGQTSECWAPTLRDLSIRAGDRVLVIRPSNELEPIVTGVLDGFTPRPAAPLRSAAQVELKADEKLQVLGQGGEPLVEISNGQAGPVVRLLSEQTRLDCSGKLEINADEIALRARQGGVEIKATDDVVVIGESINLN